MFNANPEREISWVGEKFLWAAASARFSLPLSACALRRASYNHASLSPLVYLISNRPS
jgi:hypothetical protein